MQQFPDKALTHYTNKESTTFMIQKKKKAPSDSLSKRKATQIAL